MKEKSMNDRVEELEFKSNNNTNYGDPSIDELRNEFDIQVCLDHQSIHNNYDLVLSENQNNGSKNKNKND